MSEYGMMTTDEAMTGAARGAAAIRAAMDRPQSIKLADFTTYEPDFEQGRLNELWNGAIQAMVDVRAGVADTALRVLLIAELERLGYTITSPEPDGD